ncbi:glycosyltransferase family 2 protein [Patescibacteria group bacterium]|nr:glycosyltransferase family 2 protein [Patescibacteria group bacterium]
MKKAFVIIPTYNERENILKVVPILLDVFKQVKNWEMNILVVDDSSPDKTAEVVEDFAKKHKQVHLLLNKRKQGLGGAYLKGMAKAFEDKDTEVVFEFDADLSHDPTKIPIFLKKIDEGYDMVLGSRYIPGGGIPDNWGLHRKFLSVVGNIVIMSVLTNFTIRDWTGGYRAITRKVYEAVEPEMHDEKFTGYTFQIGFLHKSVKKGFKIVEVPFKFVDRTIGVSKLGNEYIKNNLIYLFKVRGKEVADNRIFKFVVTGGIGALVQLLSLILWRQILPYEAAIFASIETAIVSNFLFSNFWTFADRKVGFSQYPSKFIQFNLASAGSIVIQLVIATLGKNLIGLFELFRLPLVHISIDTGMIYAVVGILVGMFWNFFAYSKIIWKKSKESHE